MAVAGPHIHMRPQPVTVPGYGDHYRMMEKAIQKGCCHHWIPEHLALVGKLRVGSQDHGPLFVAGIDQLEKQAGPTRGNRQKADLVDDQ